MSNIFQNVFYNLEKFQLPINSKLKLMQYLEMGQELYLVFIFLFLCVFDIYFILNPRDKVFWTSLIGDAFWRNVAVSILLPPCTFIVGGFGLTLTYFLEAFIFPVLVAYDLWTELQYAFFRSVVFEYWPL